MDAAAGTFAREAMAAVRPHARRQSRWLAEGLLFTAGVVLLRLAIPWPLKWLYESVAAAAGRPPLSANAEDALLSGIVLLGILYVALQVGIGLLEALQRIRFKRFASRTVRSLRKALIADARSPARGPAGMGDLLSRVVGDAARAKSGLFGVLVHLAQNVLFFLFACGILLAVEPILGLFFLLAAAFSVGTGLFYARKVAREAAGSREKEGVLAESLVNGLVGGTGVPPPRVVVEADPFAQGDAEREDLRSTRLISSAALLAHGLGASILFGGLLCGSRLALAGRLEPGSLFLFIAYMLMAHRRLVHVARQLARCGKVAASVRRLAPPGREWGGGCRG